MEKDDLVIYGGRYKNHPRKSIETDFSLKGEDLYKFLNDNGFLVYPEIVGWVPGSEYDHLQKRSEQMMKDWRDRNRSYIRICSRTRSFFSVIAKLRSSHADRKFIITESEYTEPGVINIRKYIREWDEETMERVKTHYEISQQINDFYTHLSDGSMADFNSDISGFGDIPSPSEKWKPISGYTELNDIKH